MADYYSAASSLEFDSGEGTDRSDGDSAYGEDNFSRRTQSITSSVYNYRFENGRRYHAYQDGQYVLPNDDDEQDRLDLQHHLFRLSLDGKLLLADVPSDVQNVLDVGAGTGLWAMEFADEYPSAQVLGIDLSPIQPAMVPPNCHFRVDDAEKEWIDPENYYDLIHSRAMVLGFRDWPGFFAQAYKHLKPGGIIELQDVYVPCTIDDPEVSARSKIKQFMEYIQEAGAKNGMDTTMPAKWVEELRAAGFKDIHIKWVNWPIGPWAKQNKVLGQWCQADIFNACDSAVGLFTRSLGWKAEEAQVMQAQTKREIREQKVHAYFPVAFCWARKPYHTTDGTHSPTEPNASYAQPMSAFDDGNDADESENETQAKRKGKSTVTTSDAGNSSSTAEAMPAQSTADPATHEQASTSSSREETSVTGIVPQDQPDEVSSKNFKPTGDVEMRAPDADTAIEPLEATGDVRKEAPVADSTIEPLNLATRTKEEKQVEHNHESAQLVDSIVARTDTAAEDLPQPPQHDDGSTETSTTENIVDDSQNRKANVTLQPQADHP